MNAVINSLTALLNVCNGEIIKQADYDSIALSIVKEGIQAAAASGVTLDLQDCLQRVHLVAEQTAGRMCVVQ